jgi:hypothetical protein
MIRTTLVLFLSLFDSLRVSFSLKADSCRAAISRSSLSRASRRRYQVLGRGAPGPLGLWNEDDSALGSGDHASRLASTLGIVTRVDGMPQGLIGLTSLTVSAVRTPSSNNNIDNI